MAKTLSILREELKTNEKNLSKNSSESLKEIKNLTSENEKLQKLLNDTKLLNSNSNEKSSHEIMEMKKKILERENEMKIEIKEKENSYKSALEAFRDRQLTEMETEKALQNNLKSSAALKQTQMQVNKIKTEKSKI